MVTIKWDTKKFNKKMERITEKIILNVEDSSDIIEEEVYKVTLPKAPVWKDVLRHTIIRESVPFRQITETRLRQDLIYDAWNPKTGFHYAFLRHEQTTTGEKYWFREGLRMSEPFIERTLTKAVRRSIR